MKDLKVITIGNSAGVIIPKKYLERFNLKCGDNFYVSEGKDGIILTPHNPELTKAVDIAADIAKEDYLLLKKLSKS